MTPPDWYEYDPSAFKAMFEQHFTYLAGFRRNTHRYADRPALSCPERHRTWTYSEMGAAVDNLARGLAAFGVTSGDVVTYQLTNSAEFAFVYLATQQCGAVGSPINYRLSHGETASILDDSRSKVFLYDVDGADTARRAIQRARHAPDVIVAVDSLDRATRPTGSLLPGALPFSELMDAGDREGPVPSPASSIYEETTRLYTSGTTGLPKGVPLNSLVEVLTAHDVIMHFPLSPEDRTLNMTPWFHRGGLYSGGPNPAFYVGAEVVPMARFDAATCLDYVEQYGLTFLIGAPTTLAMLAAAQEDSRRDLSSLRGIVTMGAPLEREACLRYQRLLTPRIFNGYGTTEAFWNTFLRPEDLPDRAGTAGRACTDDDVAVVKMGGDGPAGPGRPVAKDGSEIGEVIVRSAKCSYTYVHQPDEAVATFQDGWVHIGDLATWDEDEYVTIVGRKNDMIISGGENIHPIQVEEALNEHPGVTDAAVVGLPDDRWGELVVAYVVGEASLTVGDLDSHCRTHPMLAPYKRPRAYRFVDELPFTATGKKMHYQVRALAIDDDAHGRVERVPSGRFGPD